MGLLHRHENYYSHDIVAAVMQVRLSGLVVLCLIGSVLQLDALQVNAGSMDQLVAVIADPNTKDSELESAIQRLGAVGEPPRFWTDIANSDRYSRTHRRRAVFALFKRHINRPLTLENVARLLDRPTWLKPSDIDVISEIFGEAPVTFTTEDTVFVLPVFRDLPEGRHAFAAIYLRVEGKLKLDDLVGVLFDQHADAEVRGRRVLEVGLSPDRG